MNYIFDNFWILLIAGTFIACFEMKTRTKKYINQNPELENGYNSYFKGWLFYGNIPWIIMGIGNLTGKTNSTFDFFDPKSMNPIVILFFVSVFVLYALLVRWIYFRNGAEFFEKHPGLFEVVWFYNRQSLSASQVKSITPVMIVAGFICFALMWFTGIPTIK